MSTYIIKERGLGLLADEFDEERAAELEAQRTPEERQARVAAAAAEKLSQDAMTLGYQELNRRA